MKFSEIEFDETSIVVQSLKDLKQRFLDDLTQIDITGKPVGYVSWNDVEIETSEINKEIEAIDRVFKLYGE